MHAVGDERMNADSTVSDRRTDTSVESRGPAHSLNGILGLTAAVAGFGAIVVVLATAVGWGLTARSLLAVIALALVNAALVTLALPRTGTAIRLLLSVVLGLATAGIAVWLSGVFDTFWLRWPVAAAPALFWLHPSARAPWRGRLAPAQWPQRVLRYGPALWGLAFAWALAARWLATYFAPLTEGGPWREFYVDIPWHIALTAETLDRAPTVYPWIPDVPIGYSWLFFGTLGLLGNLTGATAAQLLLVVGPAVLALVVPVALAVCTWVISRSKLAVVIAPILFTLTHAPIFGHTDALLLMPQWVLINRDSTNAMVLAIITVLVLRLRTRPDDRSSARRSEVLSLLVLFLVTFSVAGSRGGAVLPVLGAAGLVWLVALLWHRDDRRSTTWALVVVGVAVAAATVGVTKSSGSFRLDPLSFIAVQVVGGPEFPVATLASVAVMLAMTAIVLLVALWLPDSRRALPALAGAGLAGILGAALFGHPSFSQLYFFHAGWPAIVVGLAVALALAVHRLGPLVLLVAVVAVGAFQIVLRPPAVLPPTPWEVRLILAGAVALAVIGGITAFLARTHGWRRTAVFVLPALVVALQPWSLPMLVHPPVLVTQAQAVAAVSDEQLALLAELREVSDPDDLVATNKHCHSGSVPDGNCEARWWAVSAFAERRVLMEGWSYDYTWTSSGTDNFEPYWDPALLRANDDFIADPTAADCQILWAEGVRWLYVDKREAWSPRLTDYAELIRGGTDGAVYRLRDCS
jgi:hypothetical protein